MVELPDEMQNLDDEATAKLIGAKLDARAPNTVCPFCSNKNWFVLDVGTAITVVAVAGMSNYSTYTFACTNCGFIRQHMRSVVDGEQTGPVDIALPEAG